MWDFPKLAAHQKGPLDLYKASTPGLLPDISGMDKMGRKQQGKVAQGSWGSDFQLLLLFPGN